MIQQQIDTNENQFTQMSNAEDNQMSHATRTNKSSHASRSQSRHSFSDDTQVSLKQKIYFLNTTKLNQDNIAEFFGNSTKGIESEICQQCEYAG